MIEYTSKKKKKTKNFIKIIAFEFYFKRENYFNLYLSMIEERKNYKILGTKIIPEGCDLCLVISNEIKIHLDF